VLISGIGIILKVSSYYTLKKGQIASLIVTEKGMKKGVDKRIRI